MGFVNCKLVIIPIYRSKRKAVIRKRYVGKIPKRKARSYFRANETSPRELYIYGGTMETRKIAVRGMLLDYTNIYNTYLDKGNMYDYLFIKSIWKKYKDHFYVDIWGTNNY